MCLSYLYRGKITHTIVAFVFPVMLDVRDIVSDIVLYNHINSLSLNCVKLSFCTMHCTWLSRPVCPPILFLESSFLPCYANLNKRATCEQYVWFTSLIGCFDNSNGQKQNKILTWRWTLNMRRSSASPMFSHSRFQIPLSLWSAPRVAILGADQNERGLWGRQWTWRMDLRAQ